MASPEFTVIKATQHSLTWRVQKDDGAEVKRSLANIISDCVAGPLQKWLQGPQDWDSDPRESGVIRVYATPYVVPGSSLDAAAASVAFGVDTGTNYIYVVGGQGGVHSETENYRLDAYVTLEFAHSDGR